MKKFLSAVLTLLLTLIFNSAYSMPLFENRGRVEVITYHLISKNPNDWSDYCISPEMFENDILLMKNKGYEFLKASEIADTNISKRKIAVITFDDGYKSDIQYVLPILKKHNACATFFIYGGGIGKNGYLSKEDIKALSEEHCAEIGNHSYTLHNNSKEAIINMFHNTEKIVADFKKNNELLKEITGKTPTSLSYPNGVYTPEVNKSLINSGIKITFSTDEIRYKSMPNSSAVGRKNRSYNRNIIKILK